jgi:hypothetical protein
MAIKVFACDLPLPTKTEELSVFLTDLGFTCYSVRVISDDSDEAVSIVRLDQRRAPMEFRLRPGMPSKFCRQRMN